MILRTSQFRNDFFHGWTFEEEVGEDAIVQCSYKEVPNAKSGLEDSHICSLFLNLARKSFTNGEIKYKAITALIWRCYAFFRLS